MIDRLGLRCHLVVVKKELSRKAKLLTDWSVCVPTLTHDTWIMTKRTTSQIQAAAMGFLRRVARLNL